MIEPTHYTLELSTDGHWPKVFFSKATKDDYSVIWFKDNRVIDCDFHLEEEYQKWFCDNYPELIPRIKNFIPELEEKYSQIVLAGKFGLFNESS